MTPTTPIAVMGPVDGSMVVDAVVTQSIVLPGGVQTGAMPIVPRRRRPLARSTGRARQKRS